MTIDIHPWIGDIASMGSAAVLTCLAAVATVTLAMPLGAVVTLRATPTMRYGVVLALLFVPFALGSSVWAYSVSRLASLCKIQEHLVLSGEWIRFFVLLALCLGRTVPLGVFFCATLLHRYTAELRPYFRTHQMELPFFLLCVFNRMPKSILTLLGLFGGAMMASEVSLPTFLYRANPGTGPETANIILSRIFREMYGGAGPEVLSFVAVLGVGVSLCLVATALIGTLIGQGILRLASMVLRKRTLSVDRRFALLSSVLRVSAIVSLVPGICGLIGLVIPVRGVALMDFRILGHVSSYASIVTIGAFVGVVVVFVGIATAVRLRYGRRDWLALLETKSVVSCLLMLPAFLPMLSVVACVTKLSHGRISRFVGLSVLILAHIALHYPIIQCICMSLVGAIPRHHVVWQRAVRMRYAFSLLTDGFRRHMIAIVGLVGLCMVQVITDGSVSRWFSNLVKAPDEALYASVFGRLASSSEAATIAWSVGLVAIVVCGALATMYVRELRDYPKYD